MTPKIFSKHGAPSRQVEQRLRKPWSGVTKVLNWTLVCYPTKSKLKFHVSSSSQNREKARVVRQGRAEGTQEEWTSASFWIERVSGEKPRGMPRKIGGQLGWRQYPLQNHYIHRPSLRILHETFSVVEIAPKAHCSLDIHSSDDYY